MDVHLALFLPFLLIYLGVFVPLLVDPGPQYWTGLPRFNGYLQPSEMPINFTVALVGDQWTTEAARDNLELIRDEGAHLLLIQGDLGYSAGPDQWDQMVTEVLGADFPLSATLGNHDLVDGERYGQLLAQRMERSGLNGSCIGVVGVSLTCTYRGFLWYHSSIGCDALDAGFALPEETFAQTGQYPWRMCGWHKNQRLMQVEHKLDQTGWLPYRTCAQHGAMIATGHSHGYFRTHEVSGLSSNQV